jgi:hypothetical protein
MREIYNHMKNDMGFGAPVRGTVWYQTLPLNPPATRCKTLMRENSALQ